MEIRAERVPPPIRRPIKNVVLTLTEREASYLLAVCRRIGGPMAGPRALFSEILGRLDAEGVELPDHIISGSINFEGEK